MELYTLSLWLVSYVCLVCISSSQAQSFRLSSSRLEEAATSRAPGFQSRKFLSEYTRLYLSLFFSKKKEIRRSERKPGYRLS